jgi:F0F1-type ATP synthase epsilon subunit
MNDRLVLEILTPESRRTVDGLVFVSAFLSDGSIGILPGHAPLLGETVPLPILYRPADGPEQELSPGPGILRVEEGKVTVFAVGPGTDRRPMPLRLLQDLQRTIRGEDERHEEQA